MAIGVGAALLSGCGGGSETRQSETFPTREAAQKQPDRVEPRQPQEVWVALDGWEAAETLGVVVAEKHGYFKKFRISVLTLAPATPALSIPDVLNGSDLIAVAHAPQAVVAKAKGAPIVVLGSLVSQPTAAMIWLKKSSINDIADLKGKTIAIPGLSFQRDFLESILKREGLNLEDVKVMKVGNDLVPALLKGRADAIFGGSGNLEGADLKARGLEPIITPVRKFGAPPYEELVLVAHEGAVSANPRLMRDFVAAVVEAAGDASGNPKGAIKALESASERNPETSSKAQAAEVEQTLPLLSESGRINANELQGLADWMYEQGMIQREVSVSELLASP